MGTPIYDVVDSDSQAIIDIALAAGGVEEIDPAKIYSVTVPRGGEQKLLELAHLLEHPRTPGGVVQVATVASLVDYADRHDDPAHTTFWVHPTTGEMTAVFDDHARTLASVGGLTSTTVAGWGKHRAHLKLEHTPEWLRWMVMDGKPFTQEAFAEHIEDNLRNIVSPEPAVMLEIAQTFHATSSANFRSGTRLQSGQVQIRYDEEIAASAGQAGELQIPEKIVLGLSPFIGEEEYRVDARLRFRIREGDLTLIYKLDEPEKIIRDALDLCADRIADKFGHDRVFLGTPRR